MKRKPSRRPARAGAPVDAALLRQRWGPAGDREAARDGMPSIRELLQWYDDQRSRQHLFVRRVGLRSLQEWAHRPDGTFAHRSGRFFRITGIRVRSPEREVPGWDQPILENPRQGVIGLLTCAVNGRRYCLLQARTDVGNRPPVQLAATVQFTPGNYIDNARLPKPYLFAEFLRPALGRVVYNALQSEEGARFFRESHLHRIIELAPGRRLDPPATYRWCSLEAVRHFLHHGEIVSSSARSILSCLV